MEPKDVKHGICSNYLFITPLFDRLEDDQYKNNEHGDEEEEKIEESEEESEKEEENEKNLHADKKQKMTPSDSLNYINESTNTKKKKNIMAITFKTSTRTSRRLPCYSETFLFVQKYFTANVVLFTIFSVSQYFKSFPIC